MPRCIKEQQIGDFTVRINERLDDEGFYTRFAVGIFEGNIRCYLFPGDFGYGDDPAYIQRKFESIVENLTDMLETTELEKVQ